MIKFETIGAITLSKNNPVIVSETEVANYTFLTYEGSPYLIMNDVNGDDAFVEDITFAAGEYLNGVDVKSLDGLKLIVDGKHITGGVASLAKDTVLVVGEGGKLKTGSAPESGVYFKVTDTGIILTEAAVKVKVFVA